MLILRCGSKSSFSDHIATKDPAGANKRSLTHDAGLEPALGVEFPLRSDG